MCAYVEQSEDGLARILATSREPIIFQEKFSPARHLSSVKKSIHSGIQDLVRSHPITHKKILVTLSPLLSIGRSSKTLVEPKEGLVTQEILDDALKSSQSEFLHSQGRGVILDSVILETELNGYPVQDVVGKESHNIKIHSYTSLTDKDIYNTITESISEQLHTTDISMHSFTYAAWRSIKSFINVFDFIYIEFCGELTEIMLIRDGLIRKTSSVPFGKNQLLRALSSKLGLSPLAALSRARLHYDDLHSHEIKTSIGTILQALEKDWQGLMSSEINKMLAPDIQVKESLILADSTMFPFVNRALENTPICKKLSTIRQLTASALANHCLHSGSASRENFFMLSAMFSAIMENDNTST